MPSKMGWSYSRFKLIRALPLALKFSQRQGVFTEELLILQLLLTSPFKWSWRVLWAVRPHPSLYHGGC